MTATPATGLATVQIDLDGLWVLCQFVGRDATSDRDPVLETGLPRVLEMLARHRVRATFFVNGADLAVPARRRLIERVAGEGHELANHGMQHQYLSRIDPAAQAYEIVESGRALQEFSGRRPTGFRAPGYDLDVSALSLLQREGYTWDSSAYPTVVGPLMWLAQCAIAGRPRTKFPPLGRVMGPRTPYRCSERSLHRRGSGSVVEVPVTVVPMLRLPLSFTYAVLAGDWYLRTALAWAVREGGPVNFVFHVLDFADPMNDPRLRGVPGLRVPLERRLRMAEWVIEHLAQHCEVVSTSDLCDRLAPELAWASAVPS